jgi:hypothetical protein
MLKSAQAKCNGRSRSLARSELRSPNTVKVRVSQIVSSSTSYRYNSSRTIRESLRRSGARTRWYNSSQKYRESLRRSGARTRWYNSSQKYCESLRRSGACTRWYNSSQNYRESLRRSFLNVYRHNTATNQPEDATELPVKASWKDQFTNTGLDANGRGDDDRWTLMPTMHRQQQRCVAPTTMVQRLPRQTRRNNPPPGGSHRTTK